MSTKTDLLDFLSANSGQFVSGQKIADELGISRAAISKAIAGLRKSGYIIESKTNHGYKLCESANSLSAELIKGKLNCNVALEVFDTIDSTNNYAKTLSPSTLSDSKNPPVCVIADAQTSGRGRLGRSFESPRGSGIYMTLAFKPEFELSKSLFITMASAVAVCKAIEKVCGKSPQIKWVNDIFLDGRKICGILTEAQSNFETGKIDSIIIGIGINCFPGIFPEELSDIAGCISKNDGSFSRNDLAAEVICQLVSFAKIFTNKEFLDEYRKYCFVLGREIKIHNIGLDTETYAKALSIEDDGALVCQYLDGTDKGKIIHLTTGEVSVRLQGDY